MTQQDPLTGSVCEFCILPEETRQRGRLCLLSVSLLRISTQLTAWLSACPSLIAEQFCDPLAIINIKRPFVPGSSQQSSWTSFPLWLTNEVSGDDPSSLVRVLQRWTHVRKVNEEAGGHFGHGGEICLMSVLTQRRGTFSPSCCWKAGGKMHD